jgi:hypothetical protein
MTSQSLPIITSRSYLAIVEADIKEALPGQVPIDLLQVVVLCCILHYGGNLSVGFTNPPIFPVVMAITSSPGLMPMMVTSARSMPFSLRHFLRTRSWMLPGGKVAMFRPIRD